MIKNILFDLDSTLLPMDQDLFLERYLHLLGIKAYQNKYDPKLFVKQLLASTNKMLFNDGSITNEKAFFDDFSIHYPNILPFFTEFYDNEFLQVKEIVENNPYPKLIVDELNKKGYNLVLATTPLFPRQAVINRMGFANLMESDFIYISSYENSSYAKPNGKYFDEIINNLNLNKEETLMIGNDMDDDFSMLDEKIQRIIITDHLLNRHHKEINFPQMSLKELYDNILTWDDINEGN